MPKNPMILGDVQVTGIYAADSTQTVTSTSGVISPTTANIVLRTTGVAAKTLADGVEGQTLFITMRTDNGNVVITPASSTNFATVTYNTVGDGQQFLFADGGWNAIGGRGVVIA